MVKSDAAKVEHEVLMWDQFPVIGGGSGGGNLQSTCGITSQKLGLSTRLPPFTFSLYKQLRNDKKPAEARRVCESDNWLRDAPTVDENYQARFLCLLDFKRLLRLCFDIFRRRFFLRLPMIWKVNVEKCGLA